MQLSALKKCRKMKENNREIFKLISRAITNYNQSVLIDWINLSDRTVLIH